MLVQEALDHADLPVLTATLGAAALLKNSLYCYLQHVEDSGNAERFSILQACYKRYVAMSEAVAERVLDLHCRVLSLYVLQDAGGRGGAGGGAPSVQGWWLYMNDIRKQSSEETMHIEDSGRSILHRRFISGLSQTNTSTSTTPLLLNDILNTLLCVAQLLPAVCGGGRELAGAGAGAGGGARHVRDVHAKCNELFKCFVYRGAPLHFIHQALTNEDQTQIPAQDGPQPWYTFVSPQLFDRVNDGGAARGAELPSRTALALELMVLLAQPQPSWALIVKVLTMRDCLLARMLLVRALRNMSPDNSKWSVRAQWYATGAGPQSCDGFLCTADGYCRFKGDSDGTYPRPPRPPPRVRLACTPPPSLPDGEEYARAAGALTYILVSVGSKAEIKSTLCYGLEMSGRDWAAGLDRRQIWSERRAAWLSAVAGAAGGAVVRGAGPLLARALASRASLFQTVSLCLTYVERSVDSTGAPLQLACEALQAALPAHVAPLGDSVLLQVLIMIAYEEIQNWAKKEEEKGKKESAEGARCVCEALCGADRGPLEPQLQRLLNKSRRPQRLSQQHGLQDFPEFAQLKLQYPYAYAQGDVAGAGAERGGDAAALTDRLLMAAPGRDSLRDCKKYFCQMKSLNCNLSARQVSSVQRRAVVLQVVYEHLRLHARWVYEQLGAPPPPGPRAPLLHTMFHIGHQPFDQFLQGGGTPSSNQLLKFKQNQNNDFIFCTI
ncbi:uncharacterized protein LOC110384752 [Bombyx mori]